MTMTEIRPNEANIQQNNVSTKIESRKPRSVEHLLRIMKAGLQAEELSKIIKRNRYYTSPSEKKAELNAARRRSKKHAKRAGQSK